VQGNAVVGRGEAHDQAGGGIVGAQIVNEALQALGAREIRLD